MAKELKARIDDPSAVEEKLKKLGAEFSGEALHEYVYFKQPAGSVVKLTAKEGKVYKTVLVAKDGKWDIVSDELVNEPDRVSDELATTYGIKRKLKNHRRFFVLGEDILSINRIEGVGDFLIIESNAPSTESLDRLGIKHDAIITDSFDNL